MSNAPGGKAPFPQAVKAVQEPKEKRNRNKGSENSLRSAKAVVANGPYVQGSTILSPAEYDTDGFPLHAAAAKGDLSGLRASESIGLRDRFGNTPVHVAVFHGKIPVIEPLVTGFGVDINVINDNGESALVLVSPRLRPWVQVHRTLSDAGSETPRRSTSHTSRGSESCNG